MSVWLERFGSLELPLVEAEQEIGSGGVRTGYMDLPAGGAFDVYGGERAPRGQYSLRATAELLAESSAAMLAQWNSLWAMNRKREKLYARVDDDTVHWAYARLRLPPATRRPEHVLFLPVELIFDIISPVWNGTSHGAGWLWNDGTLWDSGSAWNESAGDTFTLTGGGAANNLTVTNGGNADVIDLVFTITAPAGSTVTDLTINVLPADASWQAALEYGGTIAATESLIINGGTQGIFNDSSPDYDNLEFSIAHSISGWLRLGPGDNSVQITYTGNNNAVLTVDFDDGWEI